MPDTCRVLGDSKPTRTPFLRLAWSLRRPTLWDTPPCDWVEVCVAQRMATLLLHDWLDVCGPNSSLPRFVQKR